MRSDESIRSTRDVTLVVNWRLMAGLTPSVEAPVAFGGTLNVTPAAPSHQG